MSSAKLREIETAVGQHLDQNHLAGGITMVLRKGHIVHLETHGFRDLEKRIPMTEDTIFRIYSMTKAIVSVGVMILVEEGEVELDQPITDFFSEFKGLRVYGEGGNVPPKRMITVRDLLRHTSGFTYGIFGDSPVDRKYRKADLLASSNDSTIFIKKLSQLPLLFHPGEDWEYSVADDVLGVMIERISGSSLDRFLQERIFEPLDMKDTAFHVPLEKRDRFATYYNFDESGKLTVREETESSSYRFVPRFFSGGGGLVSTARDYSRFVLFLQNGGELYGVRLLQSDTVTAMTRDQLPRQAFPIAIGRERPGIGFGLGFAVKVEDGYESDAPIGEYLWNGIASTHFWISPDHDLGVITMEQTAPYNLNLSHAIKGIIYDAITD